MYIVIDYVDNSEEIIMKGRFMVGLLVIFEVVLFYCEKGISKSMLYVDFEVILDGMVGVFEFVGKEMCGVYCLVNGWLWVKVMVLFLIDFDVDGMVDIIWNVFLWYLVEYGGSGLDMGVGLIWLVCCSQCLVVWYQDQLWDLMMKFGVNDFVVVRDLLCSWGLKMGLEVDEDLLLLMVVVFILFGEDVFIVWFVGDGKSWSDDEEWVCFVCIIKELWLCIYILEMGQKEEMVQFCYVQQQKEEIFSVQLEKVLMQFKILKFQNVVLCEQNGLFKVQVELFNCSLEEYVGCNVEQGSEVECLVEQYKLFLEQCLEEECVWLVDEIYSWEMDVFNCDDLVNQLCVEIFEFKCDQMKVVYFGGQKIFDKLESLGLSFIVFYFGVGYVFVVVDQIVDYMDNLVVFVVCKCLVIEDYYWVWLVYYENLVCQVVVGLDQVCCGKWVICVDVFNQFKLGVLDCNFNCCLYCWFDLFIDNVFWFC